MDEIDQDELSPPPAVEPMSSSASSGSSGKSRDKHRKGRSVSKDRSGVGRPSRQSVSVSMSVHIGDRVSMDQRCSASPVVPTVKDSDLAVRVRNDIAVRLPARRVMASTSSGIPEEVQLPARQFFSPLRHRQCVILLACGSFNPPTYMHLRMFELARDHLHRRNYRVVEGVISVVNDAYKKKDLESAKHRLAMARLALENSDWIRADEWEARQTQYCPTVTVLRHIRDERRQRLYGKAKLHSISTIDEDVDCVEMGSSKKSRMDGTQSSTESSGVSSTVTDHQPPPVAASSNAQEATAKTVCKDDPQAVRVMLLCGSDLLQSFEVPDLWDPADIEEIVRDFGIVVVTRSGHDPRKVVYESDVLSRYEKNIHYVTEWNANDVSSTKIRRALKRSESVRYLISDRVLDYIYQHKLYGCAQRHIDILSSPSSLLDSTRDAASASRNEKEDPHCSYHPEYKRLQRKSVDESDYDNLSPCPCPLTCSASLPNAVASEWLRSPRSVVQAPRISDIGKGLSLDLAPLERSSVKPSKFPADVQLAPLSDGYRGSARSSALKSALRSPPPTAGPRQRAVSYHSDLGRSTGRSPALPSSRTMDMGDTGQAQALPYGSVSLQQRSLSNLAAIPFPVDNGAGSPQAENGQTSGTEGEEIAWHYNPEVTKSLPNLRLRQTPPRHVRILDKGVCFTAEDRQEEDTSSNLANNLVVKIKQLKLTMSPETTV